MKKGFTLLELLIVIGILAVLASVVALVLNPAELLRQARDGQRMSDLQSVNRALGIWMSTASSPSFSTEDTTFCSGTSSGAYGTSGSNCGAASAATTSVAGTGWVKANLTLTTGGTPLSALPLDPSNTASFQYAFEGDNTSPMSYELNAILESDKFATTQDLDSRDGGDDTGVYEIGTKQDLNLI